MNFDHVFHDKTVNSNNWSASIIIQFAIWSNQLIKVFFNHLEQFLLKPVTMYFHDSRLKFA